MFGLLNINKPPGVTSRDVVDRAQRWIRPDKVGHAGTLDPLATGVLVLCVGGATRLIQFVQQQPKRYTATFTLGLQSETDDIEGEVTPVDGPQPTCEAIEAVLPDFVGTIQQRPPAFSAIKVRGQRAYKLAREGNPVELAARPVTVHGIEVVAYEYPRLVLDIRCGGGTYIRSIGRDLARRLRTSAVMSALERTAVGPFVVGAGVSVEDLDAASLEQHLLPAAAAVQHLPAMRIDEEQVQRLANGVPLTHSGVGDSRQFAALDPSGRLVAILTPYREDKLRPAINFAPAMLTQVSKQ